MGPGPFAAMMLADLGAEVLRIGRLDEDVDAVTIDLMNRGKKSVALDLKSVEGREAVLEYATRADVLIEGFRPGVLERLGIGPEVVLAVNPRLIYGRITGWGHGGSLSAAAGHDINFISLTGALHTIGSAGGPPVPPLAFVGDFGGGAMSLAFGIVAALCETQQSALGQIVEASIVDGAAVLTMTVRNLFNAGLWQDERGVNLFDGGAPFYSVYETRDGKYISVGAYEPRFFANLLEALDLDQAALPRQFDRDGWPELRAALATTFLGGTRDEWCARLEGTETCFAPVLSMTEAPLHPQNRARDAFANVDGKLVPAPTPRFRRSGTVTPRAMKTHSRSDPEIITTWGEPAQQPIMEDL
ncbi:CaiB/BaiF CoA-transferase family protein [soil metagenome]